MAEPAEALDVPPPLEGSGERPRRAIGPSARVRLREPGPDPEAAAEDRELRASIRRLRYVLGIGLFLWNLVGVPNDLQVTATFDLSYAEFTWARVISSLVQLAGWSMLFVPGLGRRGLQIAELLCFVATSAGLAALNHGLAGPTPLFVSCALLAQGASVPRPWREGLPMLAATWLTFPLTLVAVNAWTGRNVGQWADPSQRFALLHSLLLAACTLAFVVLAGDALHGLKRRALAAERVGRYRLVERLGGGAMGEVWRARHPGLAQDVALKLATSGRTEARLAEEAAILTELSHPSTVRLVDRGRGADGRFFYAMELLAGETLAHAVARRGPLSIDEVRGLGVAVGRALAEAHAHGIVHRDVKPENVILCEGDVVKLLDFGVALRLLGGAARAQEIVGSPRFMAPEQRSGAAIDARADVFGLGAVLAFARSGASPLDTADGPDLHALDRARSKLLASSEPLDRVIAEAITRSPDERTASASALVGALLDAR
ncbi:MAG: serine/threonine protein kinase [Sandaracinaceae bacterium]|nr:serine/threonine protein kinase [Sandaracinaceae bacterium]